MAAADEGHEACVKALLRAKANTELLDETGRTALQWAEIKGHTAIAKLIRQHTAPPQPAAAVAPQATQAEQAAKSARADAAMKKLLAEEAAEQAKAQAPSKKSKKKNKARREAGKEAAMKNRPCSKCGTKDDCECKDVKLLTAVVN